MERLNAVLPYIKHNKCALFIGAGLSKIAGCYDWDSVAKKMLDHIEIQESGIKKEELIGDMENEKILNYCFNIFKRNGNENTYWGIVREALVPDVKLYPEKYFPVIKLLKLITPFPQIITTNIDNCLENTKEFNLSEIYYKTEHFIETNLNSSGIFHIHGSEYDLEKSLLTREQYIPRYREASFRRFLKSLFKKYCVIFIGYGLRDREILDIMQETNDNNKYHFLLLPEEDMSNLFNSSTLTVFKELNGIESIIYGKRNTFPIVLEDWITKYFKTVKLGVEDDMRTTND
ncbi:MAG: hypothetical protein C4526_07135 [Nitrospiraceae bacterium]|nr:MAG: hypothetical protein C4526_07135 [Nitrospiraceae bacterium]